MNNNAVVQLIDVTKELSVKSNSEQIVTTILANVNLTITRGEFTSITGPSGSGKTSLLYLMGGLDQPTYGTIFLEGKDITAMSEDELAELRNTKLGFVYQFHFLLPEFNALENVMIPMMARGRMSSREAKERALGILEQLGMAEKRYNKPNQLSGGQQQRVAIARALANEPLLLLADEPTGNLDSKNAEMIYDLFTRLNDELKQTIVVVTHDEHFASRTRRRVHILDGRIYADEAQ
ncbi:MAG: ABC transporter ATP-binding protein [Candidatus Kryptoniota bacterium]